MRECIQINLLKYVRLRYQSYFLTRLFFDKNSHIWESTNLGDEESYRLWQSTGFYRCELSQDRLNSYTTGMWCLLSLLLISQRRDTQITRVSQLTQNNLPVMRSSSVGFINILSSGSDSIVMAVHRILLTHVARSKLRYIRTARPAWILSIEKWSFQLRNDVRCRHAVSWRTTPERQFIL